MKASREAWGREGSEPRSSLGAGVVIVLALAACGRGGDRPTGNGAANVHPPDGSGAAPTGAGSSGTTMASSSTTVTVTVAETRPGRPPLVRLVVDVAIDNPGDAPRWITIPKQVPFDGEGGVDGLDVYGQGAALLGTFRGNAGVHALRVAPHAKVTIENLEVGWWRTSAKDTQPPPLAIAIGDALTIGGEPAKAWFGVEPLAGDGARIDVAAGATGARAAEAEEPLTLAGATPAPAALTLPAP